MVWGSARARTTATNYSSSYLNVTESKDINNVFVMKKEDFLYFHNALNI